MSYRDGSRIGFEPTTQEGDRQSRSGLRPATRTTGRGFRTRRRDLRAYRDRLSVHGARSRAVRYVFMGFEPMVSCASNELANSRTHESRTASDRSTTKLHSNRRDPPRSASSVHGPRTTKAAQETWRLFEKIPKNPPICTISDRTPDGVGSLARNVHLCAWRRWTRCPVVLQRERDTLMRS